MDVFPAHAGVILEDQTPEVVAESVPRTRGGDPAEQARAQLTQECSPHTRG